ncbi:MAG: alpha/beta fold hydrolase [Thermodesulfobacteriota bacterium]
MKKKMILWAGFLSSFAILVFSSGIAQSQNTQTGPGTHKVSFSVKGTERTYLIHVPASYNPQNPMPLVIMLHGGGGTGRAAMWETGWAEKAEKEGFLSAFPNAMAADPAKQSHFSRNPQLWNDGSGRFYSGQKAPDDVGFIAAMLDDLSKRYPYNKGRVFVTGFSNGASMSFLAAAKMPERIASIAPVAGALWFDPPKLKPPVSMCYITGTADPLNIIEGGVPKLATGGSDRVRAKPKPPVRESILRWAKALDCPEVPKISEGNGVRTETYSPGLEGSEVVYISVEGLGHTWPGGRSLLPEYMVGKTTNKIKAVDVIWAFFLKHSRPYR